MEHLVKRSVSVIHTRFHEPLSLDDLARSAMVSKFYFLRLFRRTTGVTPGRFLSAVRLHEAKRLLLTTSLNVAEISAEVGYSSTGTFSRRFSESVGVSPTQYRQFTHASPLRPDTADTSQEKPTASIAGTISLVGAPLSSVYLGLFTSPILQGHPVASATVVAPGLFQVRDVPPGTWYLHAVSFTADSPDDPPVEQPLMVDMAGPLRFSADADLTTDLAIKPSDWTCPPVLFALPGIDPLPARPGVGSPLPGRSTHTGRSARLRPIPRVTVPLA